MPKHRRNHKNDKKPEKKQGDANPSQPSSEQARKAEEDRAQRLQADNQRGRENASDDQWDGVDDLDDDDGDDPFNLREISALLGEDFEIVDPAEEDEEWDDVDLDALIQADDQPRLQSHLSAAEVVEQLLGSAEMPSSNDLYAFSDLTRQDADQLRDQWDQIPLERRQAVVQQLVELTQEDIDIHLGRLLRIAIHDSDATVRQAAVEGLWDDGNPNLIGPFIQILHNDPAEGVRAKAATGLGGFVLAGELEELDTSLAMRAEEALLNVLLNDQEPLEVRRRALESIAFSGEAGVRQLIEDAYYAPDEDMRVSSVFAMGRSADIRFRGLVRAELQNPSPAMRIEAALACGELEASNAVKDLFVLLTDRDEEVRLAAIFALGRIGGPDARDALETMMLSENPTEVTAAEDALEEMQFYSNLGLFDESLDEDEEWEDNSDDSDWYDLEERDLGEYDNDAELDADINADLDDTNSDNANSDGNDSDKGDRR